MKIAWFLCALPVLLDGCSFFPGPPQRPARVAVAAIQFHSVMGDVERNRTGLAARIEEAARRGARIVVLPECAVPGYADLTNEACWVKEPAEEEKALDVRKVAEPQGGPSVLFFGKIADRLDLYLTVPFIEQDGETFYNSVTLLGPDGQAKVHYRKQRLWPVADSSWATAGPEGACVVETEFGRLGLMICYDVHAVLPMLAEARADIVLYSVAFFGPNSGAWFEAVLARRVRNASASLILANWTFPEHPGWSGFGHSLILGPDGQVLAKAGSDLGDEVVVALVPRGKTNPRKNTDEANPHLDPPMDADPRR